MAVVVVNWSAGSPSIPTIRVQIPLTPAVFSVKIVLEKNENKQQEAGVGTFKKPALLFNTVLWLVKTHRMTLDIQLRYFISE